MIVEVVVDTKKVPSSQNEQTNCEFETRWYLYYICTVQVNRVYTNLLAMFVVILALEPEI